MNRRAFLTRTALAAPALLTLGALPAMAATSGSTFIEAPGLTASGTFDIPGFGPGGNGRMQLNLTNGPLVRAQFGPAAIDRIVTAGAGARIGIFYQGFNGQDDYVTRWSLTQAALGAAAATFTVDGGLSANASALLGGDPARGAGLDMSDEIFRVPVNSAAAGPAMNVEQTSAARAPRRVLVMVSSHSVPRNQLV